MHITRVNALNIVSMSKKEQKQAFVCQNLITNELIIVTNKTGLSKFIGVHRNTMNSILDNKELVLIYKHYRIWKQITIMN